MGAKPGYISLGGEVEEEESVERQGDADVVDDGGVDVAVSKAPVPVLVKVGQLEEDNDEGHDALHDTELESALLAEPQEADVVALASAQRSGGPVRLDWFPFDLRHDVALPSQILVAQTQEVVDHEGFIAVLL